MSFLSSLFGGGGGGDKKPKDQALNIATTDMKAVQDTKAQARRNMALALTRKSTDIVSKLGQVGQA